MTSPCNTEELAKDRQMCAIMSGSLYKEALPKDVAFGCMRMRTSWYASP